MMAILPYILCIITPSKQRRKRELNKKWYDKIFIASCTANIEVHFSCLYSKVAPPPVPFMFAHVAIANDIVCWMKQPEILERGGSSFHQKIVIKSNKFDYIKFYRFCLQMRSDLMAQAQYVAWDIGAHCLIRAP